MGACAVSPRQVPTIQRRQAITQYTAIALCSAAIAMATLHSLDSSLTVFVCVLLKATAKMLLVRDHDNIARCVLDDVPSNAA